MHFFGAKTHLILLVLQNIDWAIFYISVCLNQDIFKESTGGQTRGVKKVKKRSLNSKLENLLIYKSLMCKYPFDTPGLAKYRFRSIFHSLVCLSRVYEVKIYLFIFSPKCTFYILLYFSQILPMGPSMKLIYLQNTGLQLFFSF